MREHVDAVLLDFDGTLFDTAPDLIAALNRTLSELGHAPVPFDDFRQRAGAGAKRLLLAALAAQGAERPDDATLRPLIQQLIAHYFEIETERIRPFPAVVATIERLREAGVSLAVCTNRGERSTRRLLAHFAIDRHIEAVLAGDTVERMKPDPGHVREALAAPRRGARARGHGRRQRGGRGLRAGRRRRRHRDRLRLQPDPAA